MAKDTWPGPAPGGFTEGPRSSWMKLAAPTLSSMPPPRTPPVRAWTPEERAYANRMGWTSLGLLPVLGGLPGLIVGILAVRAARRGEASNMRVAMTGLVLNGALLLYVAAALTPLILRDVFGL